MGMGQTVTALYELIPADELLNNDGNMGNFTIRYRTPADGTNSKPREIISPLTICIRQLLTGIRDLPLPVLLWLNLVCCCGNLRLSFQCEP